jgi:hypothetical protein
MTDYADIYLPIPDLNNVIAIDFDVKEGKVYYTDVHLDMIR